MNHKYSTWVLIGGIGIMILVGVYAGIDGSGTTNYIPKYVAPDRLQPSILMENNSDILINGSRICTESNGICLGGGTTNNITNNINYNVTDSILHNLGFNNNSEDFTNDSLSWYSINNPNRFINNTFYNQALNTSSNVIHAGVNATSYLQIPTTKYASAVIGMMYWNTTRQALCVYNGTVWRLGHNATLC